MAHAITNQPFALVRDHLYGTDRWHPLACVDRKPGPRAEIVLTAYDCWFANDESWYGPFQSREQASNFLKVAQSIVRAA